jgi:hypothetical protein
MAAESAPFRGWPDDAGLIGGRRNRYPAALIRLTLPLGCRTA